MTFLVSWAPSGGVFWACLMFIHRGCVVVQCVSMVVHRDHFPLADRPQVGLCVGSEMVHRRSTVFHRVAAWCVRTGGSEGGL